MRAAPTAVDLRLIVALVADSAFYSWLDVVTQRYDPGEILGVAASGESATGPAWGEFMAGSAGSGRIDLTPMAITSPSEKAPMKHRSVSATGIWCLKMRPPTADPVAQAMPPPVICNMTLRAGFWPNRVMNPIVRRSEPPYT